MVKEACALRAVEDRVHSENAGGLEELTARESKRHVAPDTNRPYAFCWDVPGMDYPAPEQKEQKSQYQARGW